jgi:glycosyltransferase involved in cell wall biosynthesis
MKIAVYTITKNEEQFIERWAQSCEEADYRLIVDTGSTDGTVETARKAGCEVASITVSPWRFDDARNAALALIPSDIDICVSLDADEILMPGWRNELESLPEDVTRPRYKYVWSWNPDGTEGITFFRDHIHKRHGYRWKHPVHEIVISTGVEKQAFCALEVHHHADASKSRGQYLPLLELAVKEDPDDDRNLFYLGREYMFHGRNTEAIPCFTKHLELSSWPAERATSMRYLARVTGNKEYWLLKACGEAPERREPWVDLAQYYYEQSRWESCYAAAIRALQIAEKPLEYLCEPEAWGALPHDLAGIASWNMGMQRKSLLHTVTALQLSPYDNRIRVNAAMMYRSIRKTEVHAVIPSKSNMTGLKKVVDSLLNEESVAQICVVADGKDALKNIIKTLKEYTSEKLHIISVEESAGIHLMWNEGANFCGKDAHILYINDDVEFELGAVNSMAGLLDSHEDIGITCPNYDNRLIAGYHMPVTIACPGNYDGTDGLAGFCMMLRSDLAKEWSFDERMKWYYGDNDVVNWVIQKGKTASISGVSSMGLNPSWTKTNDPPKNFNQIVEQDRLIFEEKWLNEKST